MDVAPLREINKQIPRGKFYGKYDSNINFIFLRNNKKWNIETTFKNFIQI